MDRQYLQSFTVEQLDHYLKTLKRRVMDLKQLSLSLGKENEELGETYEALIKKKQVVHHANQQKKNGFAKWVDRGKARINNIFHSGKKIDQNNQIESLPQNLQNHQIPLSGFGEKEVEKEISQFSKPIQSPQKMSLIKNFNFDDIYVLGKQKLASLFKRGKQSYNPNAKGEYEVQHQIPTFEMRKQANFDDGGNLEYRLQRENAEENIKLQENGDNYRKAEINQSAPQSRIAQFIKRTHKQEIKLSLPQQQPEKNHVIVVNTQIQARNQRIKVHDGQIVLKEYGQNEEQKIEDNVDNFKNQSQDNQFDVQYDDKVDHYELKEQNVCEIVEKETPQSVQDIQEIVEGEAEREQISK